MADRKISELDSTILLTGAEELAVVQPVDDPKGNVKISLDQIKEFVLEDIPASGVESVQEGSGIDIDQTDPLNPIVSLDATIKAKVDNITVTQPVDLDAIESNSNASKIKTDFISVTQAVDLDQIESRVNELDAAVILKGGWDASAGTFPGAGVAQAGWSYQITVAGTVDGIQFSVNDRIIALTDNASTITYANNWLKADYSDLITSLDGQTGALTLGAIINILTDKATLVDGDYTVIMDSADSNASKKWSFANIKANLKSYFDTLYTLLGIINPTKYVFDGQGGAVLVGTDVNFEMPRAGTFSKIVIIAKGTSPTCTFDIRKVADGTSLPTSGDSICGGNYPTLATGNKITITDFTSWTGQSFSAKDTFQLIVTACNAAVRITVQFEY